MKRSDILGSNLIIFFSLFFGTIILGFISEINDYASVVKNGNLLSVFQIGILGSIFSFFTYGIFVWPLVLILNLLIEIVFLKRIVLNSDFKWILFLETIVVFFIALNLSSHYQYYYWLFLIPIFSIGQCIRLKQQQ